MNSRCKRQRWITPNHGLTNYTNKQVYNSTYSRILYRFPTTTALHCFIEWSVFHITHFNYLPHRLINSASPGRGKSPVEWFAPNVFLVCIPRKPALTGLRLG